MATGEIFDPKKDKTARERIEPKIVGAPVIRKEPPTVLDKTTKQETQEFQVTKHEEIVTVKEHVRSKPQRKDEPEVRIRTQTREERESWNRVKRGED